MTRTPIQRTIVFGTSLATALVVTILVLSGGRKPASAPVPEVITAPVGYIRSGRVSSPDSTYVVGYNAAPAGGHGAPARCGERLDDDHSAGTPLRLLIERAGS